MIITRNKINVKEKDYLILTNVLNKQDSQNKNHHHSYTPSGSVSVQTNPTFTGTENVSTSSQTGDRYAVLEQVQGANGIAGTGRASFTSVGIGNYTGGAPWGNFTIDFEHQHSFTAKGSISGGSYTFNGSNANTNYDGGDESRPVNYTTKYWKRIS